MTAPLRRRGPGPRPATIFKYQLQNKVPTNLPNPPACDTKVIVKDALEVAEDVVAVDKQRGVCLGLHSVVVEGFVTSNW
jgi:hypothetical protein